MVGCEVDGQDGGTVIFTTATEGREEYQARAINEVHQQKVEGSGLRQHKICLIKNIIL